MTELNVLNTDHSKLVKLTINSKLYTFNFIS